MYKCKHCNFETANCRSIASHTKWCKNNPNRCNGKHSEEALKAMAVALSEKTLVFCKYCQKNFDTIRKMCGHLSHCPLNPTRAKFKSHKQSDESKLKLSVALKLHIANNPGSRRSRLSIPYTNRFGVSYVLKSSWELQFSKILDSVGVKWEYESLKIPWVDDSGGKHTYHPDFVLGNRLLFEVKPQYAIDVFPKQILSSVSSCGYRLHFVTQTQMNEDFVLNVIGSCGAEDNARGF